jgi:hypothetical protein
VGVARGGVLDGGSCSTRAVSSARWAALARSAQRRAGVGADARAHLHGGTRDVQRLGQLVLGVAPSSSSSPPWRRQSRTPRRASPG